MFLLYRRYRTSGIRIHVLSTRLILNPCIINRYFLSDLCTASCPSRLQLQRIIPIGLIYGVIYYVVFRFAIVKFNFKTPGREDDDDIDENQVTLANNDYTQVASIILEGLGGKGNIKSVDNCITRLRLEINDYTLVNEKKIKSAGVAGVIRPGKTSVQVIVGTQVQFVADEFKKLCQ